MQVDLVRVGEVQGHVGREGQSRCGTAAEVLVEPHDQRATAVLGGFDRLDHRSLDANDGLGMPSGPARDDARRVGDGIPRGDGTSDVGAGDEAETESVGAEVGVRVGELRAAQQARPHRRERRATGRALRLTSQP